MNKRKILNLEPTNKCNRNCVYCGDKKIRPVGFMSLDLAEKILKQFDNLNEVRLYLSGEPLLHPEIIKLIKLCKKYAREVELSTNTDLFTATMINNLVKYSGLGRIIISLHKGVDFDKIRLFLKRNNHRIHTMIKVIIPAPKEMPLRSDVTNEFPEVDEVEIRRPHNWDVRDSILGGEPGVTTAEGCSCWFPQEFVSVYWDGRVATCCNDLNGKWIIGDFNKDSLEIIEAKLDDICSRMRNRETIPELCNNCERYNHV